MTWDPGSVSGYCLLPLWQQKLYEQPNSWGWL